ncbi:MAG: orotidine-5'-phosphate decarboxylase [Spirochaetales bacterium]|nr:orotidine-5'-phosphate decarboxylase [Spirochaetales bacterium]
MEYPEKDLFFSHLAHRAESINSLLCVGLDPRVTLGPEGEMSEAVQQIVEFNRRIIDATAKYTLTYKPNIAFYEAYGVPGLEALEITLGLIPNEIPVILDAKRGDIGATAEAYARGAFEALGADAITLSPYMGRDSIEPFLAYQDKGVFILCRTSNPGNRDFQDLGEADTPLYLQVADKALAWDSQRIGLVVGANELVAMAEIRARHPRAWFLAPGIGTQGGDLESAVRTGMDSQGLGILPMVARGIAQAENPQKAAEKYTQALNKARQKGVYRGVDPITRRKTEVLEGLLEAQCFKTGEFTLKSGDKSPFYIDLRLIMSYPTLLRLVAKAYADLLKRPGLADFTFDRIAGIPAAGLPLAAAVSLETGIPMIFPRTSVKDHGTKKTIEGLYKPGERVLLLDDLITTGTSKIEALKILRDQGLVVEHLVVLLERGVQGRRDMEGAGVHLEAVAPVQDFFPLLESRGTIHAETRAELESFARR